MFNRRTIFRRALAAVTGLLVKPFGKGAPEVLPAQTTWPKNHDLWGDFATDDFNNITNFGFSIPSGVKIEGVRVTMEYKVPPDNRPPPPEPNQQVTWSNPTNDPAGDYAYAVAKARDDTGYKPDPYEAFGLLVVAIKEQMDRIKTHGMKPKYVVMSQAHMDIMMAYVATTDWPIGNTAYRAHVYTEQVYGLPLVCVPDSALNPSLWPLVVPEAKDVWERRTW